MRVLYDGWTLARRPNSGAALHLLSLLAMLPHGVEAEVALPADPPFPLPAGASPKLHAVGADERSRLRWEQRVLPSLLNSMEHSLMHLVSGAPSLFTRGSVVFSPAESGLTWGQSEREHGIVARVRTALQAGALSRTALVLWPDDLPTPREWEAVRLLPAVVHPAFRSSAPMTNLAGLDIPETYILYHGPYTEGTLRQMLAGWSWAASPLGDYYPLVCIGAAETEEELLRTIAVEFGVSDTVQALPIIDSETLAAVYHRCSAVFHPAQVSPWSGAVRLGLASGKPVVSRETALADALVGPAAYLVPGNPASRDTARALGAALVTVIVEESVAQSLKEAAEQRSAAWGNSVGFTQALEQVYRELI